MTRVLLDTNILVSALLNPHGTPAQILLLSILEPDIQLCVSGDVFAEYEEVLGRPLFRRSGDENPGRPSNHSREGLVGQTQGKGACLLRPRRQYVPRMRPSRSCALSRDREREALSNNLGQYPNRDCPPVS